MSIKWLRIYFRDWKNIEEAYDCSTKVYFPYFFCYKLISA